MSNAAKRYESLGLVEVEPGVWRTPPGGTPVTRWLAGWAESFLWLVNYYAEQWADALNRRYT